MENTLSERMSTARNDLGKSQKELAAILKISTKSWQDYELGKSIPGGKVFESLVRLGFNANWLLTGEGPMRVDDGGHSHTLKSPATRKASGECSQIPQYNAEPAAGHGAAFEGEQVVCHMPFSNKWLKYMGLDPACLVIVAARGDSMQPTIKDGALLMLDTRKTAPTDGIYVLRLDGGLIVKRLQINPLDKSVTIKSDNGTYDPITAQGDQLDLLDFVGRVVWIGNRA